MAFKMKNPSVAKMVKMAGNNRTAMKMKAEEAAAMKMKKAAMKLKEEAAMKLKKEAAMKLKKESAMKNMGAGHDEDHRKGGKHQGSDTSTIIFPRNIIRGSVNAEEHAKAKKRKAAKNESATKMKKDDSSMKLKKESPAKMGHSPKKMKKSAMKLSEADKKKALANAMPAAEKEVLSKGTVAGMKKYFGGVNASKADVRKKLMDEKNPRANTAKTGEYKAMLRIARSRFPGSFKEGY
jgi:hypothetical protein